MHTTCQHEQNTQERVRSFCLIKLDDVESIVDPLAPKKDDLTKHRTTHAITISNASRPPSNKTNKRGSKGLNLTPLHECMRAALSASTYRFIQHV